MPAANLAEEWESLRTSIPDDLRGRLAELVGAHTPDLAGLFYETLLRDAEAAPLLSHSLVSERLHGSLQRWLQELFPTGGLAEFDAVADRQRMIGAVHARVRVPMHLVMRGGRILKRRMLELLAKVCPSDSERLVAAAYVFGVFDIVMDLMGAAFVEDRQAEASNEEAFRHLAIGQDITLERETQRGALLEWSQTVLFAIATGAPETAIPSLSSSNFGLWAQHRAGLLFRESHDHRSILSLIRQVDREILPAIARARQADGTALPAEVAKLQALVQEIRFHLDEAFQSIISVESGRDPLTKTLNRRFLSPVLAREIGIAAQQGSTFSVLMIDLDHFKSINDRFGHPAGDTVLQQAAGILLDMTRQSDFVFRFGGEEFLIVLVETGAEEALRAAERIRERIAAAEIQLRNGQRIRITSSIGAAVFDGHPDFKRLVERADKALYQAKHGGRNRVVLLTG